MRAIAPSAPTYTFRFSATMTTSSVISSQIEILESKINEVITELKTPKTITPAEAQRIGNDAKDLLAHYRNALSQLMTPNASRDPEILYFDKDGSSFAVDEDPTRAEILRCQSIIRKIESCGLDLSNPQDFHSYQILAHKTKQVFMCLAEIDHKHKDSIAKFSSEDSEEISAEELESLKTVTDRLNENMQTACQIVDLHTSGKVNRFTLDAQKRFIQIAILTNQIAKDLFQTIQEAVTKQLSNMPEGQCEDEPAPFYDRLMHIEDLAYQMLDRIDETENNLDPKL